MMFSKPFFVRCGKVLAFSSPLTIPTVHAHVHSSNVPQGRIRVKDLPIYDERGYIYEFVPKQRSTFGIVTEYMRLKWRPYETSMKQAIFLTMSKIDNGFTNIERPEEIQLLPGQDGLIRVSFISACGLLGYIVGSIGCRSTLGRRILFTVVAFEAGVCLAYPKQAVALSKFAYGYTISYLPDYKLPEVSGKFGSLVDASKNIFQKRTGGADKAADQAHEHRVISEESQRQQTDNILSRERAEELVRTAPTDCVCKPIEDHGMSSPADKDLYSTRTSK